MLGYLGAISSYLGSMLGHVGSKMRQDDDDEDHQVEPNMGEVPPGVGGKHGAVGPYLDSKDPQILILQASDLRISILEEILLL